MKNDGIYTGAGSVDRVFRALGDPHRIRIIELLREKELSAGEILEAIDVVQSTLSHHMKTLADSGAVNAVRRGKWTYYSLNKEVLAETAAFLGDCANGTSVMRSHGPSPDAVKAGETKGTSKTSVKTTSQSASSAAGASKDRTGAVRMEPEKPAVKREEKAPEKTGKKKDKKNKKSKKSKK